MSLPSSSTSSSETPLIGRRRALKLSGWVLLFLIVFDIGVNLLFAYPPDPRDVNPNRLQMYFDYGRSTEGRLRRGTRADPKLTAPITLAGWYTPLVAVQREPKPSGQVVTIYGNSQSVRLADALQNSSLSYSARTVAAPGATVNWAYGAFLRDEGAKQGEAVVLTIMPSNLPMIRTMSAMTWNTSFAMPYTADVFELENSELVRHKPPYETFEDYASRLDDKAAWHEARKVFARYDSFYDAFLMEKTVLDHSTIVRLLRRGWAQRRDARVRQSSLNRRGFNPADDSVEIANAIIAQFAAKARLQGLVPVIYIVNSRGYGDQMFNALVDTLEKHGIPYVSSHLVVDPNDPRNYLPDSHFTDANDQKIANALDRVLNIELGQLTGHQQYRGAVQ